MTTTYYNCDTCKALREFGQEDSWTPFAQAVITYFKKEYLLAEKAAYRWSKRHNQPLGLETNPRTISRHIDHTISMNLGKLCHQYNEELTNPSLQKRARAIRIKNAIYRQASYRFDILTSHSLTEKDIATLQTLKGLPRDEHRIQKSMLQALSQSR